MRCRQVGNKRNSAWRGGQKAHGPVIRDYSIDLNRKYRAMGMMIVLAAKFREGNLIVFNKLECKTHKTKDAKNLLIQHGLETEINSTLFVDEDFQREFLLATSNIPLVLTLPQNVSNITLKIKFSFKCVFIIHLNYPFINNPFILFFVESKRV